MADVSLSPWAPTFRQLEVPSSWDEPRLDLRALAPSSYFECLQLCEHLWVADGSLRYEMEAYTLVDSDEPLVRMDGFLTTVENVPAIEVLALNTYRSASRVAFRLPNFAIAHALSNTQS